MEVINKVFNSLTLPNGSVLKNRIVKAAMEEDMAGYGQVPNKAMFALYKRWANGGAGLLISGNVFIDKFNITAPGALVLEKDTPLSAFQELAKAGKENNTKFWLQLNHPGAVLLKDIAKNALSPSGISLKMGNLSSKFVQPKVMTEADILNIIERFASSAKAAYKAGFDGVQIHAAHGYLLTQFLSPLSNTRNDLWGGSLENRSRIIIEIIKAIRNTVPSNFSVGIKINSADFQRGGFDIDDAKQVVAWLNELSVDLIELSGGTYESTAMQGNTADNRTLEREAYFLNFAKDIATVAKTPIMTTGGIRRLEIAEKVLNAGIDLVGIGTAFSQFPDLPNRWQAQQTPIVNTTLPKWKNKMLLSLATILIARRQFYRMGRGMPTKSCDSPIIAIIHDQIRRWIKIKQYKKWLKRFT
jgi:2,4-dienoyl-CoA reductase-like NADH-dependent reductase (Old Yellow Enzyme family)